MPFYEITHSYPLTGPQKEALAKAITHLHSRAFLTPSHFVHVAFKPVDPSSGNYFLAGERITQETNRIWATVRTGSSRTKEEFDELAGKIEDAWKDTLNGPLIEEGKDKGQRQHDLEQTATQIKAKRLALVVFTPFVTIRENGHVIPAAGQDVAWFKEMMPEFKQRAEAGEDFYKEMLEEIESREDFQKALSGGSWFGT